MTLLRGAVLLTGVHPLPPIAGFTAEFPDILSIQQSMLAAASDANRCRARIATRWGAIHSEGART